MSLFWDRSHSQDGPELVDGLLLSARFFLGRQAAEQQGRSCSFFFRGRWARRHLEVVQESPLARAHEHLRDAERVVPRLELGDLRQDLAELGWKGGRGCQGGGGWGGSEGGVRV